jgi:hypothetical protein
MLDSPPSAVQAFADLGALLTLRELITGKEPGLFVEFDHGLSLRFISHVWSLRWRNPMGYQDGIDTGGCCQPPEPRKARANSASN